MFDHATLRARSLPNVQRPLPARLVSRAPNRHPTHMNQLKLSLFKSTHFVRILKLLQDYFVHKATLHPQKNTIAIHAELVSLCGISTTAIEDKMIQNKISDRPSPLVPLQTISRRKAVAGVAITLGSLGAVPNLWSSVQEPVKEIPSTPANAKRTSLHQEVDLKTSPQRIYEVLLDSKQFTACTGTP